MKKQTDKALTGLQWALAQRPEPRKDDEFTAAEYLAAGGATTKNAARSFLRRMVEDGQLESRGALEGGKIVTLYRKKSPPR
jgi:hypothetical protein